MKFVFKALIVYFKEEKEFNCKNNHESDKLANL